MMKIYKVLSVNIAKNGQRQATKLWVTKPFHNWKNAVAKMKEHSESESHRNTCQAETFSVTAILRGSIAQQVQKIYNSDRLKNKAAINFVVHTSLLINILPILLILVTLLI